MSKIEIFEQELKKGDRIVGKVTILRSKFNSDNLIEVMEAAVSKYVGEKEHNQFIEVHIDNPWVRVVIDGINELDFKDFTDQNL